MMEGRGKVTQVVGVCEQPDIGVGDLVARPRNPLYCSYNDLNDEVKRVRAEGTPLFHPSPAGDWGGCG